MASLIEHGQSIPMPDHETECPRENCEGNVYFWEESSESYTNNGLSVWTHNYLVMDGNSCSEGHSFTDDEVKQMEKNADEAAANAFVDD